MPLWSNGASVWRANCPDLTAGDINWWVASHGSHAFVSNPIFVCRNRHQTRRKSPGTNHHDIHDPQEPDLPITYAEPGTVGLGGGGIGARAVVKTETVGVRLFSNQRVYDLLPWKPSRYLRLAARSRLCAGTIISRNARCAPPPRDVYPYLAIRPLGGTGGWRRNRRL
jgi:hypothetical protein